MTPDALIGRQLAGKYTIEGLLGVGGFGAVYRATQSPIDRIVAVKVSLHPHRADLAARFMREARVLSALRHPGCVTLLDCGWTDGLFYLVQEFVSGHSLKALLDAHGPLAPERALDFAHQMLDALAEAHRHGIVHRDIKPANVMITRGLDGREEVRVLDFGIAKITHADTQDDLLTVTGMSLGTPAYMAPEQIRPGPIGPWTDVYAVGATLHHMLIGRPPFRGIPIDVLNHQLSTPIPPLPPPLAAFDAILERAMAKSPADRISDARALQAALAALALGGPAITERNPAVVVGDTLVTPISGLGFPAAPDPPGPTPAVSTTHETTTPDLAPPPAAAPSSARAPAWPPPSVPATSAPLPGATPPTAAPP
ncbi:MAG: serine/threonine protein kinase, partial [Myxococcales bacterium]|nr:serine/threonine protein kinase [Myxococcales bacterium]